jgi:hypothetical protein
MLGTAAQPEIVVAPCPYLRAAATPGELYPVLDAWFLLHTERGAAIYGCPSTSIASSYERKRTSFALLMPSSTRAHLG